MQIETSYAALPQMLHPAVAQQAHTAVLAQNPGLASAEADRIAARPRPAQPLPTNSIDILI
jgi:hypothetical protein